MPSTTIAVGVALTVLGLAGYFLTGMVSFTALIPAVFGVVIGLCGLIARDAGKRKHAMHAAVAVAGLGAAATAGSLLKLGGVFSGTAERPAAIISQAIMAVLTLGYVIVAVRSFLAARQTRG
jgi:hypothetical protein